MKRKKRTECSTSPNESQPESASVGYKYDYVLRLLGWVGGIIGGRKFGHPLLVHVQLPHGERSAKPDPTHLHYTLEPPARGRHLLVQLRALREARGLPEVVGDENF